MEKWTIRPDPTSRDPKRHVLLLKGSMKDVTAILKKFGSSFGRPGPASADGYNLSIVVHELDAPVRRKLEAVLREMAPPVEPVEAVPPPIPILAKAPVVEAPAPEPPAPKIEAKPMTPNAPADRRQDGAAPASPPVPKKETPAPAPKKEEPAPAPVAAAPAVPPPARRPPAAEKPLWGLTQRPDEAMTFDSLMAGPYNRFAHAASASVVGAPGTMYNPLFLYGAPGTGKTHFVHAIARSLGQTLGEAQVLLTSGSRLSRAATLALAQGRAGELEGALARAKALLIDDVHLLAVTESNRALLTKAFATFLGRGLQVALTSIYPPRALASLEETLNISLGKGWSIDLKMPSATVQMQIMQSFFDRNDFNVSSEDAKKFHERLGSRYFESPRWMRRLMRLKRLQELAGKAPKLEELLAPLFDEGKPEGALPDKTELAAASQFAPPPPSSSARALALFAPKGRESLAPWIKARFFQTIGEFGVPQGYRLVLEDFYDSQEPFGVPFQLGEACGRAGVDAVLVVGPPEGSRLAERETDFVHAVDHILDGSGVRTAWIGCRRSTLTASFLRAHLDLAAF